MQEDNKVLFGGNVTREPRVSESKNGPVVSFNLANDYLYSTREGAKKSTTFVQVTAFGDAAKKLKEQGLKKGDKVTLAGRLQSGSFEKKQGAETFKVYTTEIVAESVEISR